MPRIRTIKPEFCTSEQVVECSTNARLLFVLLWCFCDDAGRHPSNTRRIKMEVFPGDAFTTQQIRAMLDELIRAGLLIEYTHESKQYLQVTGWKHQRIDKPSYKYPPLDSKGIPIPFDEHSTTVLQPFEDRSPPEGNGREGIGEEGNGDGTFGEESPNIPARIAEFTLSGGQPWFLTEDKHREYQAAFPMLDLSAEYRQAGQWLRDNPERRKTARGMPKFLFRWLSKTQNNGHANRKPINRVATAEDLKSWTPD